MPFPTELKVKASHPDGEHPPILAGFVDWLAANAAHGELGSSTPEEAAYLLYGIVYLAVVRWDHSGRKERLTELAPRALELFFHGVRGAPSEGQTS